MANKKLRCKQCRDYFGRGTMIRVPAGNFCSDKCMFTWLQKKRVQDDHKAHREKKEKFYSNDRATQLKLAQTAFNSFIRERDKDRCCISCNRSTGAKVNAGHYRSVGAAPHLRFNQFNVSLQCEHCNCYKSGNAIDYRINLIKRYGVEIVERVEGDNEPKKWTLDEIVAIKEYYRKLLKRIKE